MFSLLKSWRFGLGFLAFVVAGSLLLLAWMRQREREESNRLFQALARADAEFVQLVTQESTLEMSGEHLVFVAGKANPVRADSIQVGDVLHPDHPVDAQHT